MAHMNERIFSEANQPTDAEPTGLPSANRRRVISIMATGIVTPMVLKPGTAAADAPMDYLVDANEEADFKPLRPADLHMTKPLLVLPYDVKAGAPRKESRLNKLVVVRLPEEKMTPETRARSVQGIVAYSSICTHQGCDVKTWMSKESVLACYCHASKFDLFDGAKVVSGPASGPLRAVPLAMSGEFLSIAASLPPKAGD